jgi:hypothetical protein
MTGLRHKEGVQRKLVTALNFILEKKKKVKFAPEQATKVQSGRKGITLLFL